MQFHANDDVMNFVFCKVVLYSDYLPILITLQFPRFSNFEQFFVYGLVTQITQILTNYQIRIFPLV